jgi:methionyl-tRNA synthetase
MSGFYVTTAIPYVNAAPHLGHALELVQADVLARHRRRRGGAMRFLTGTDDNAFKNVAAARAAGGDDYQRWWAGAERVHVIGKGIVRFHAVHWPALLLSAGRPLPTRLFVHDYLTVGGTKIAKSGGARVPPARLTAGGGLASCGGARLHRGTARSSRGRTARPQRLHQR